MKNDLFNNFTLTDDEVLHIIDNYKNLIMKYSSINMKHDEDLYQEIVYNIIKSLTKNR